MDELQEKVIEAYRNAVENRHEALKCADRSDRRTSAYHGHIEYYSYWNGKCWAYEDVLYNMGMNYDDVRAIEKAAYRECEEYDARRDKYGE